MLVELFNLQHDLQVDSFGYNFQMMDTRDRIAYIQQMHTALGRELYEALDETTWKPWATGPQHINVTAYVGELVDALHFLVNMFIATGEDPTHLAKRVFNAYLIKHGINADRQAAGYDGTNKCPRCGRALDDPAVECDPSRRSVSMQTEPITGTQRVIEGAWCGEHGMYNPDSPTTTVNLREYWTRGEGTRELATGDVVPDTVAP